MATTIDKIKIRLKLISWETPFGQNRFNSLGSRTAVAKALSFLTQKGVLQRVGNGFYIRTRPDSVKATLTTIQLVRAWAEYNDYRLVRDGKLSAYLLGFLPEAPARKIFWTSGPSREFKVGDEVVYTRRITDSKLIWPDSLEGDFFRGLLSSNYNAIETKDIFSALNNRNISDKDRLGIIDKISEQRLLRRWQSKLEELRSIIKK